MNQNKFQYETVNKVIIGIDWTAFKYAMMAHQRGEVLIREQINWDTDQMRKYFHGPVRAFILGELRKKPFLTTADQLKRDLKLLFGPKITRVSLSGSIEEPKSTADYTFKEYLDFLNRINEWCIEKLGFELPPAEMVE